MAGYIFGGNGRRQKIAMTAPVTKFAAPEGWRVRFTMPARHALEDLPAPDDPAVKLHDVSPARYGVLRFSGLAGEAKVAEATARLQTILAVRGLVPVGPATIARYNPPWTPWFLRRNEVMFPVTGR